MNRKITMMFLVSFLLVLLLGAVNASEVSNDTATIGDTHDTIVQDTPVISESVNDAMTKQKETKKITKEDKNSKTASTIYVSSYGTGDGSSVSSTTNLTHALSKVKNNQIIMMVTNASSDTYKKNITLTVNDTVNIKTNKFSIIGQEGKQIIIMDTLKINENLNITLKNLVFKKNATILSTDSSLTVENCTFTNIRSLTGGILIMSNKNNDSNVRNIINNKFTNISSTNTEYTYGAVSTNATNTLINNNTFQKNKSPSSGGSIIIISNKNNITNNIFNNNTSEYNGGAVLIYGDNNTLSNNRFTNNIAPNGGALCVYGSDNVVYNNSFKNNNATLYGGAASIMGLFNDFSNNSYENNHATEDGGAINAVGFNARIANSTFTNNHAVDGGAINNKMYYTVMGNNTFNHNNASGRGGAIFNNEKDIRVLNNSFIKNVASYGGGVYNLKGSINITDNIFENNKATDNGGALYNTEDYFRVYVTSMDDYGRPSTSSVKEYKNGNINVTNNQFINNTAQIGGAIYDYLNKRVGIPSDDEKITPVVDKINNNLFRNNKADDATVLYANMNNLVFNKNTLRNNTLTSEVHTQNMLVSPKGTFEINNVIENIIWYDEHSSITFNYDYAVASMINSYVASKNAFLNNNPDAVELTVSYQDGFEVTIENESYIDSHNNTIYYVNNTNNKFSNEELEEEYVKNNTIKQIKPTVKLLTGSFNAKPGQTIKLVAHITELDEDIDGGQLVFKLNGVSLTDTKGNAVIVNIKNGLGILEYKIPDTLGARTHNLTAVYASEQYGRIEVSTPMTIAKYTTHIDVNPIYTTTNTIQVKAQVVDQNNQALNKQTAMCIKINGKSFTFNSTTGTINYKITQTLKDGYYNITIISGENGKYLGSNVKTVLIKSNTTIKTNYINNSLNARSTTKSGNTKTGNIMSILTGSSTVKPGDRLKLIAHLSEDKTDINGGQLVFKLNGLSIRDEKNNSLVVNISKGLGILDYKIPDTLGARTHNLTAVYSSKKYGKVELTASLTMNKLNTHIEAEPIYAKSSVNYINARILDDNNQPINKQTSVVIKVDGKSYSFNTTTGTINYKIPTTLSKGLHHITIISGENGKYLPSRANTVLIKI